MLCKDMGLDYEEYAKELRRVEMENEAGNDYRNEDLAMNEREDEPNNEPIRV